MDATSLVVNQEIKVIATIAFNGTEAEKDLYIVLENEIFRIKQRFSEKIILVVHFFILFCVFN